MHQGSGLPDYRPIPNCVRECLDCILQAYSHQAHLFVFLGPDGQELLRSGSLEVEPDLLASLVSFSSSGLRCLRAGSHPALIGGLAQHRGHLILVLESGVCSLDKSMMSMTILAINACYQTATTQDQLKAAEQVAVMGDVTHRYAHEMKNVLAVIRGSIDLLDRLLEKAGPAGVLQRTMGRLRAQARDLESLTLSLLAVRRSELDDLGEDLLQRQRLDWLVAEAVSLAEVMAHTRDISIHYESRPVEVSFNWRLLEQAVLNLLKNALEASRDGQSIEVRVEPGSAGALVSVKDEGPGIPEEAAGRIFDPFFTTRAASGGTGLGLAVTRHIVEEVHGGRISVATRRGQGACFVMEIPD